MVFPSLVVGQFGLVLVSSSPVWQVQHTLVMVRRGG